MAEMNFADFQFKLLRGIGYSNLSSTNRAYQWIKNNSSVDGPCLNYLKNYITDENFVTLKEMSLYNSLTQEGFLPRTETEIDAGLAEYYDDFCSFTNSHHVDASYLDCELSKAETYLKELEQSKSQLQKYYKKMETENNQLKAKIHLKEGNVQAILERAKKVDSLLNEHSKNVQEDLNKIGVTFHKLVDENATEAEEHSIFRINFEIFKKINCTFRNTVDVVVEKQFGKFAESTFHEPNESGNYCFDAENRNDTKNEEIKKKIDTLILNAFCLGKQSFNSIMIKCQEAELKQLSSYLTTLKTDVLSQTTSNSTGIPRFQVQTSANADTISELETKSEEMRNFLDKYYESCTLKIIFFGEKTRLEQKFKSDKKCLRKVSDLCSKYVDLITLQACFLENEKDNVNLALHLYNRGLGLLKNQTINHSNTMENLRKLKTQCKAEKSENSFLNFAIDLLDLEDIECEEIIKKFSDSLVDIQKKILAQVANKLNQIQFLQSTILDLDEVIFNGPAKQPFYAIDIYADKRLIDSHYVEYCKIYRDFKRQYHEELERLNNDEYLKMEKLLWITFLTNPKALQENLQNLRQDAGVNKSAVIKRTNVLSVPAKAHRTFV